MSASTSVGLRDLARLPRVGSPERAEWDRTIRGVNELYPDWSWITVAGHRFHRETYEVAYKRYYAEPQRN